MGVLRTQCEHPIDPRVAEIMKVSSILRYLDEQWKCFLHPAVAKRPYQSAKRIVVCLVIPVPIGGLADSKNRIAEERKKRHGLVGHIPVAIRLPLPNAEV